MWSLNILLRKLFRWFRRPQLLATEGWQLHYNNLPVHASCLTDAEFLLYLFVEFFGERSNHPGDSGPLQPRFGALRFLAFPQTKLTFEREEISDHRWDSGKYDGAAGRNWENCVRSQGAYFERDFVLCTMFLYLIFSSINVSIFHITWLDTFWTVFLWTV